MNEYKNHITPDGNVVFEYDQLLPAFDACKEKDIIVHWIQRFFASTGATTAVVGISGGKDSSVVAALCVEALGVDNVIGVKMSDGGQDDWEDQRRLIEHLGIKSIDFDIGAITQAFRDTASDADIAVPGWSTPGNTVPEDMWDTPETNTFLSAKAEREDDFGILQNGYELPRRAAINLAPRVRMATLYMIAQSLKEPSRVANTCNLSEDWVGYSTRWGDSVGDFCPIQNYTATEVQALGYVLGLPEDLIDKAPSDGLCGKTDEDSFGFSYADLDLYIRLGSHAGIPDAVREKINAMHERNEFKLRMPPACFTDLRVLAGRE